MQPERPEPFCEMTLLEEATCFHKKFEQRLILVGRNKPELCDGSAILHKTTKKGIVCLYLSLGSLSSLSSPPHTALTDSVGSLLQQFNLNVPGTRRDLHLFESRCHPGASRKAKSPERVAPCSAPHTISQHIAGNTRTSHTRSLSETCFLGWKPGLDSSPGSTGSPRAGKHEML
jgi:hypothetical protein